MIAHNSWHAEDEYGRPEYQEDPRRKMPKAYADRLKNVTRTKGGKAALTRYRKFWGIPLPPEIDTVELPGPKGKEKVLVGLGTAPYAFVADGPKGKNTKTRKIKGPFLVVCDPSGKKMMLLKKGARKSKKASQKQVLTPLGWAPETHYVPSKDVEAAGTFKRGKYWIHKHDDEGGTWPKVSQDQAGNIIYSGSTLRISKWMRR